MANSVRWREAELTHPFCLVCFQETTNYLAQDEDEDEAE